MGFVEPHSLKAKSIRTIQRIMIVCAAIILLILATGGFDFLGQSFHHTKNTFLALMGLGVLWGLLERRRLAAWFCRIVREERRILFLSLCLLIVAGIPRLHNLDGHSINVDEPLWMHRGEHIYWMVTDGQYIEATENLGHPGIIPAALIGLSGVMMGEGGSDKSLEWMNQETAARLPIAILGTLTCLLLFLLGRLIWGERVACLAALFLALDPFHTALSRVAHVDSALTLFCMLALLSFFIGERDNSWRWVMASGLFWGCALITKGPAWLVLGILIAGKILLCLRDRRWRFSTRDLMWLFVGLGVYFLFFTRLWQDPTQTAWWRPTDESFPPFALVHGMSGFLRRTHLPEILLAGFAVWKWLLWRRTEPAKGVCDYARFLFLTGGFGGLVLLGLLVFRFFPNPFENMTLMFRKLFELGTKAEHAGQMIPKGPGQPGYLFYPFALCIRLPLFLLISSFVGALYFLWQAAVSKRSEAVFPLLVIVLFAGGMSQGLRLGLRYILPVYPFLSIVGAAGFFLVIQTIRGCLKREAVKELSPAWLGGAGVLMVLCYLPIHLFFSPNYFLYHNALIGGPEGAKRVMTIGWGEGQKEAVEYIQRSTNLRDVNITVVGDPAVVRYYWNRVTRDSDVGARIGIRGFDEADYLVVTFNWKYRNRYSEIARYIETHQPVHTVHLQGADVVWVYQCERNAVTNSVRYEAEDPPMARGTGTLADKADASSGRVIAARPGRDEKGWVLRGPSRAYEPGTYRLNLRMRVGKGRSNLPAARLELYDGISREPILVENLFPVDFNSETYQNRSFPFRLEHKSVVSCSLWYEARADVAVDYLSIEVSAP
jgi:4-amino-4-deoxy-L-arabinose transferase-like glycosyltransferase